MREVLCERDWGAVERLYALSKLPYIVLDDFFLPDVCRSLSRELRSSQMWHAKAPESRELYLFQPKSDTLFSAAEELRCCIPSILAPWTLVKTWAFLHTEDGGVGFHSDAGRVTLNIWLTEDQYNLLPGRSGLLLTSVQRPDGLSLVRYSTPPWSDQYFSRQHDGEVVVIPYRHNRAVLFDARLYHASDQMSFDRSSTEAIRLNVGLEFDDPVRAWQEKEEFERRMSSIVTDFETRGIDLLSQGFEAMESLWHETSSGGVN